MLTRLRIFSLVFAGSVAVAACSPTPTQNATSQDQRYPTSARSTRFVESGGGLSVSEADAFHAMVELARTVAIALQSDSLRLSVYNALHASPYREHKLHFRTFTEKGAGAQLLSAAATISGRSVESMRNLRDAAIDLEFYMPVKSHFASWTGDANLLVATSYDADDDLPIAFALSGEQVMLTSAKIPPATPTLVLVRREESFAPPSLASLSAPGVAAGVYMTFSYLSDKFEGFPNGDPELEIHTNWRLSGDTLAKFGQCSGEDAGNPSRAGPGIKSTAYEYNQDNNTWSGLVRIIDSAQAVAAEAVDSIITYWVWEDDAVKCEVHVGNAYDPDAFYKAVVGPIRRGHRNKWSNYSRDPVEKWIVKTVWNIIQGIVGGANDDFVGLMADTAFTHASYTDANMTIINPTYGTVGRAMLSRYDAPPPPPPPPPPLTVTLTGPASVRSGATCLWTAASTTGTAPYTYSWNKSPNLSSIPGELAWQNAGSAFTVTVTVQDAVGATGQNSKSVTISGSAPLCNW